MGKGKKCVFDSYDYEQFYSKKLDVRTGEVLEEIVRDIRGVGYTTATIKSGNQLEVEIYPHFKNCFKREMVQAMKKMSSKKKESTASQRNLNDRNARKRLFRLIHANFNIGDYFCTFTFKDEPSSVEEVECEVKKFFRRINDRRKRLGLSNAKYVYVIEKSDRFHVHVVMDSELSMEDVEKRWVKLGMSQVKRLRYFGDNYNFKGLSTYLFKEQSGEEREKYAKRWSSSKGNLVMPKATRNRSKLSKRKVLNMVLNQDELGDNLEHEYPNYRFREYDIYYNDVNGLFYIYARLEKGRFRT